VLVMPRSAALRATYVAIAVNLCLLAMKATATNLSDSLTIFSETLNSLSDVVSAIVILLCVRWAWKSPDESHPFGHRRAEPIAGLVVAIFTGILGFEVCKTAVLDLWHRNMPHHIGPYPIVALCITAVVKTGMTVYFRRRGREFNSPALRATAVDCRNDVVVVLQGLIAVVFAELRLPLLDVLAALLVGGYILYGAHRIGMENIDYLMGRAPEAELLARVRAAAAAVPHVQSVADIRGHYVGTFVHVELTAAVDGALSTTQSHDVSEAVRSAVESLPAIDRAFVHISPETTGGT
jgi:cation diffusion facilitator family transporter